jgi:hypothetical protein
MKNFKKNQLRIIFIFILICFCFSSYSQISSDMIKYWYYRNRLNNYFVIPGEKQGESQIIAIRNKILADNDMGISSQCTNVDYGQHGKYTGLYLGVLATEYYLLNKNGQYEDAAKTQDELYKALYAIKTYWDEKAEVYWTDWHTTNPDYTDPYNGFFIRGNVPCYFFNKEQTENLIS